MRMLYLHQYFNPPEMSGGPRSYEMARRLVAWGHQVNMITTARDPSSTFRGWKTTRESGIHVYWLHVSYSNAMSYPERIIAFLKFAVGAALRAASLDGDVVFATSTPLTIALPAVYAWRRRDIPMVFDGCDLWPELPIAIGALRDPFSIELARWLEWIAYHAQRRPLDHARLDY